MNPKFGYLFLPTFEHVTELGIQGVSSVRFEGVELGRLRRKPQQKMEAELRDTLASAKARRDGVGDNAGTAVPKG